MRTCPTCQQSYSDETDSCPRDGTPLAAEVRDERECPHCAELILKKARVCKHCGRDVEPLVGSNTSVQAPPPAPPGRIGEPPSPQPQGSKPIANGMGKCIAYFAGLQILSSPPSARMREVGRVEGDPPIHGKKGTTST